MLKVLPYLFLLFCPLMMLFMMRGMNHGAGEHSAMPMAQDGTDVANRWDERDDRLAELEREVTELREECNRLRSQSR